MYSQLLFNLLSMFVAFSTPASAWDCVMAEEAGVEALSDGVFVPGEGYKKWTGEPVAVKKGEKSPSNGAFCRGCIIIGSGEVAPSKGSFYPY